MEDWRKFQGGDPCSPGRSRLPLCSRPLRSERIYTDFRPVCCTSRGFAATRWILARSATKKTRRLTFSTLTTTTVVQQRLQLSVKNFNLRLLKVAKFATWVLRCAMPVLKCFAQICIVKQFYNQSVITVTSHDKI